MCRGAILETRLEAFGLHGTTSLARQENTVGTNMGNGGSRGKHVKEGSKMARENNLLPKDEIKCSNFTAEDSL